MLDELTHVVQCRKIPGGRWETIAAFDTYDIARRYVAVCESVGRGYLVEHRVVDIAAERQAREIASYDPEVQ